MTVAREVSGLVSIWCAAGMLRIAARLLGRDKPLGHLAEDAGKGLSKTRLSDAG